MRLTDDRATSVVYIALREREGDLETVAVGPNLLVDIDATGRVGAIELLDAREKLVGGDSGNFMLVDSNDGGNRVAGGASHREML